MNSFKSLHEVSKVQSNLEMFRDMGKICSNVILFFYNQELKGLC